MAIKTYKLRLDFKLLDQLHRQSPEEYHSARDVHQWLWDTHVAFNTGVDYLAMWLLTMRRGAGVLRERNDGIWGEWSNVTKHQDLIDARAKVRSNPNRYALIENHELLSVFCGAGKMESEAVELAECCRHVAENLCPPSEERDNRQMPRDSLDLLISPFSEARGLRAGTTALCWELIHLAETRMSFQKFLDGAEKLVRQRAGGSKKDLRRLRNWVVTAWVKAGVDKCHFTRWCGDGEPLSRTTRADRPSNVSLSKARWVAAQKRFVEGALSPGWLQVRVIAEEIQKARSWRQALSALRKRRELSSEKGEKRIQDLHARAEKAEKDDSPWRELQCRLIDELSSETRDYARLLEAGVLPLPTFGCYHDDSSVTLGPLKLSEVGSEWKRSMWDMAGQRVRSHLGWVRRRASERLLWEKRKKLFIEGGWIRTRREGRNLTDADLTAEDIVFSAPADGSDFQKRPGYGQHAWFTSLREYEREEMPKHLERVAFASGAVQRLTDRTIKGWSKVRDRWLDRLKKDRYAKQEDLLGIVNGLRTRKPREFGDQRAFEWLSHPDRRWLWDGTDMADANDCGRSDRDCVSEFVDYNRSFADRPESITFTQSHATLHPVWPFFGENSAVTYTLMRQQSAKDRGCLVLRLAQLLVREKDGTYRAADQVKIPLRAYDDFDRSFNLPANQECTAKQEIGFSDDLLAGGSRPGTLSGIKLVWDRGAMERVQSQLRGVLPNGDQNGTGGRAGPPLLPPTLRVYVAFSCNAGDVSLPAWLPASTGKVSKLKKPRDGMTEAFFLSRSIREATGARLRPGERRWPREAVENGFCVRGTDLGFRTSSAGAWWRLSFKKAKGKVSTTALTRQFAGMLGNLGNMKPEHRQAGEPPLGTQRCSISWLVGHCPGDVQGPVYAVLEHEMPVSLPGDGEDVPAAEKELRDRLHALRTRLNLNNMLLRVARLLTLREFSRRVPKERRMRERRGGARPDGLKWETTSEPLSHDEIKENCRKAADQLLRWWDKDSMTDSLKSINFDGSVWEWFAVRDDTLAAVAAAMPETVVPSEKEAKEKKIDRGPLLEKRKEEDAVFADLVYAHREALADAIATEYDSNSKRRARNGLWAEFDRALLRDISYADNGDCGRAGAPNPKGMLRLLRKPPVTKHHDRKDEKNNLPHGRTHRGGLSMARLNFLDEVKSFVRKWSCRSRWPGDVRRLAQDAKFDRQDTEHLDHLREHRAKLIAHADVAQALGFEQDLRRGVWRFPTTNGELWHRPERGHFYIEENGELTQVAAPDDISREDAAHPHPAHIVAHVLVYEDLSRYLMRADRPKNENAGLARWSHRRILKYAQHVGGLFGTPVATVLAAYSSRFCSHCGAPGCRASRFDPSWLDQQWIRRIMQSTDIRDMAMKAIATEVEQRLQNEPTAYANRESWPWVLRDGGTHFVCASRNCQVSQRPIDADENAAANIGLWFLRGIDDFRVKIDASGKPSRALLYTPIARFEHIPDADAPYWQAARAATTARKRKVKESLQEQEVSSEDDGAGAWLFRDPSGNAFPAGRWYEPRCFWGEVARYAASGIKAANASRWADLGD